MKYKNANDEVHMNDQKMAAMIQQNFVHKVSYVASKSTGMFIKETDEFLYVDCGMPADTFNIGVLFTDSADDQRLLHETVDYFTDKNFPMSLWCWENIRDSTRQAIVKHGLFLSEVNIGMYAYTSDLHPAAEMPDGFSVRRVSSPMEVRQFGAALSSLFGNSMEGVNVRKYYDSLSESTLYNHSDLKLFIGFMNEKAACIGSAMYSNSSVGIYDIATLPEQRKKGLGSAMFNSILSEIKNSYDGLCVLQASEAGANLYRRAGFREVCNILVYENRNMLEVQ